MFFKHAQVHRSRGCPAGLVNLRGIPPPAIHQCVIGGQVCLAASLYQLSEYSDPRPGRHPQPRLTGPWRDASVGRQELLVQCPCTHHRSIPPYAIRVAKTDVLTGFSAPLVLSTTMPPPASHHRNTYTHEHGCMHACTLTQNRQIDTFQSSH